MKFCKGDIYAKYIKERKLMIFLSCIFFLCKNMCILLIEKGHLFYNIQADSLNVKLKCVCINRVNLIDY